MAKRQRQRRQERRREHARREGLSTLQSVITGLGVTATAVLGISAPAFGAPITVTSTADPGDGVCDDTCTLREAVDLANTSDAYDDIFFASNVTGTISLNSAAGSIAITNSVDIHGPGPGTLSVDGGDATGLFYTDMNTAGDYVTIEGLRLANGYANTGGAISDINSQMSIYNTILTSNVALIGGAIYETGNYPLFTTFSTLEGNYAIYGGGIASYGSFGLLGAVTMTDNSAYYGGAINGYGGRIYDSTISGNQASEGGSGGAFVYYAYSYNAILANNTGGNPDVGSPHFYAAFDLVENPGLSPLQTPPSPGPNITGQDPQLGALANNGGQTPTLKPAAGSPVVDKGYTGVDADQRFLLRPIDNPQVANAPGGNGADIGSVELSLGEGPQPPAPQQPGATKKKKCKKKKKHHGAAAKKKKCKKKKKKRAVQIRGIWDSRAQAGHALSVRSTARSDWGSQAWVRDR